MTINENVEREKLIKFYEFMRWLSIFGVFMGLLIMFLVAGGILK